jgi:hypothetical protein
MHPTLIRQLAADRIRERHAKAGDERRARQARQARLVRRRAPAERPRLPITLVLPRRAPIGQLAIPDPVAQNGPFRVPQKD